MIQFSGIELVRSVEAKTSEKGTWAMIHFANDLSVATFNDTAIDSANKIAGTETPLSFIGNVKAREYNGKTYPNFQIEMAWPCRAPNEQKHKSQVDAARVIAKEEEDLPF